jgi:hypothetical protein
MVWFEVLWFGLKNSGLVCLMESWRLSESAGVGATDVLARFAWFMA